MEDFPLPEANMVKNGATMGYNGKISIYPPVIQKFEMENHD